MTTGSLQRWVIDTNYLERPELAAWLAARPEHIAVLAHPTMVELHKRAALRTVQQALRICCRYSSQVVVLRATNELIVLGGRSKGMIHRLIDHAQTAQFGSYCRTVITAPTTPELADHVAPLEAQAVELLDSLTRGAANLITRLREADAIFTDAERKELRGALSSPRAMSGALQRRTCEMTFDLAQELTHAAGLPLLTPSRNFVDVVNRLAFRYAAMITGYYIVRKRKDGDWISNPGKQLNQVNDLKIAALASYFDGLKTAEIELQDTYRIGCGLVRALGGYTRCGRGAVFVG